MSSFNSISPEAVIAQGFPIKPVMQCSLKNRNKLLAIFTAHPVNERLQLVPIIVDGDVVVRRQFFLKVPGFAVYRDLMAVLWEIERILGQFDRNRCRESWKRECNRQERQQYAYRG